MIGGSRPIVVAHRGGAAEAPENTIEAFERAIRLGYPGVEFDVRCSQDGVPVVVHDAKVRIAPGRQLRAVSAIPLSALASRPTLDEVLALPWGRIVLMVEVKPTTRDRELGALAARAVMTHGRAAQAVVASFSRDVLASVHEAAPELPIMALIERRSDEAKFDGLPLFGWGADVGCVDRDSVRRWKSGSREAWTWTVKTLEQMRQAFDAGVDGLITDIPGEVLKQPRRR